MLDQIKLFGTTIWKLKLTTQYFHFKYSTFEDHNNTVNHAVDTIDKDSAAITESASAIGPRLMKLTTQYSHFKYSLINKGHNNTADQVVDTIDKDYH